MWGNPAPHRVPCTRTVLVPWSSQYAHHAQTGVMQQYHDEEYGRARSSNPSIFLRHSATVQPFRIALIEHGPSAMRLCLPCFMSSMTTRIKPATNFYCVKNFKRHRLQTVFGNPPNFFTLSALLHPRCRDDVEVEASEAASVRPLALSPSRGDRPPHALHPRLRVGLLLQHLLSGAVAVA